MVVRKQEVLCYSISSYFTKWQSSTPYIVSVSDWMRSDKGDMFVQGQHTCCPYTSQGL